MNNGSKLLARVLSAEAIRRVARRLRARLDEPGTAGLPSSRVRRAEVSPPGPTDASPSLTETAPYSGGHGTPIVLLHGFTSSWRAWRPLLALLEPHHRVFVPTLAGHAGGPPISAAPELLVEGIVDVVCRQLDEAGIGSAHVVGNSFGGWVALEIARRGRARSVIGLSPGGAWRSPGDLDRLVRMFRLGARFASSGRVRRLAGISWTRRILARGIAEHPERLSSLQVGEMFEDLAGCVVVMDLLSGIRVTGPLAPFATLDCPVRIAWAENDRVLPFSRYGLPMLAAVPDADFMMMPGVGHVPMHDDPELVARTILEFTARVDGSDPRPARRIWPRDAAHFPPRVPAPGRRAMTGHPKLVPRIRRKRLLSQ